LVQKDLIMPAKPILLSFDVEEHHRIEAAVGYDCPLPLRKEYATRMETSTLRLLDLLAEKNATATFFIVGQIAISHPQLIRAIHAGGHEIASHGWDHQRVHRFTPATFLDDVRRSKDTLEQIAGVEIHGYRAPTFSVVRETGWAIDVLASAGFSYDSSIFPVRHDRYGISDAPRMPFWALGREARLLEIPPVTLRMGRFNLPVAGGGYFRLFPLGILEAGLRQAARLEPSAAMLYFHPWEFDPSQPRLPLGRVSKFRTYVGIGRSSSRLRKLLARHRFTRAIDVVNTLRDSGLSEYRVYQEPALQGVTS